MKYLAIFLAAISGIESRRIVLTQPSLRMVKPYVQHMQQSSMDASESMPLPPPPPPPPSPPPSYSQSPYTKKLIGADPATWSPKAEFALEGSEEFMENVSFEKPPVSVPSSQSNIENILSPLKESINNTKVDLYLKEQDVDLTDIINLNALVLFQYMKDIIHFTTEFGDSDDLTDLVILVAKDIKDYKYTKSWNNMLKSDYKINDLHRNDYL
jgi:hypothetical protein